ncbi:heme biosynthesis HemY N-terminal domain-containing protein [Paracoccus alkanivorans]|uniref:Heme biosynthesis protein HemY n=1 Tax=Paracoccus alkanivorans TaxID=2116655 RepID=A0A3M0ML47_9RHOB|nr:heme biosynthesis HemY N-terminal domain-containing protein [Paracoccus alkanivorans]RMC36390.1 heme biosynthesis protein HemY [Paracoccus alkanivorans]
MLLSLLKILFFFAVVLAIALGAMQLSETGQTLRLEYAGTEIALTPIKAIVALLVLMVLAWLVFKLLGLALAFIRFIAGDETAISRYFARSRERKGYDALGEGMLAVASGEGKLALAKAARAEKFLDRPHITDLLTAQAAEVAGDSARANATYRKLLEDERTRFVGIRGLMRQKLEEGDTRAAMLLAQKAYAIKPSHKEIQNTLLDLQTREHDWKGARAILKDKRRQGELPKDVALRRDAVLALQEASEVLAQGNSISAREAAISAAKASPDLIPASVLAARSYIAQKDPRNATRILEKTWSVRPHPDVAAAYAEIVPDETPNARLRRFEALLRKNPDHEESRLLKAELLLAAEDFPGARRALGDLAESHPTVRTLSIMAAVERGEGADDSVVRGWLARALTASRGPQWICDKCSNVMSNWAPVCDSCAGFDTLTWREPEEKGSAPAMPGAEMLPLLVGASGKGKAGTDGKASDSADVEAIATPEPAKKAARTEIADVAPGMVPREEDYVEVTEPATTVTAPEKDASGESPSEKSGTGARAGSGAVKADGPAPNGKATGEAEIIPVRPDVEPPEEAQQAVPASKR